MMQIALHCTENINIITQKIRRTIGLAWKPFIYALIVQYPPAIVDSESVRMAFHIQHSHLNTSFGNAETGIRKAHVSFLPKVKRYSCFIVGNHLYDRSTSITHAIRHGRAIHDA